MFERLESLVLSYADVMPLPVFAAVSSFVEEIIAPIPSGPVMLVMGSLAQVQGYALPALLMLAVVAACGKLAGALVVYIIADKAEDFVTGRFAKLLGISHAQIESFGKRLGNGWRDYILLTVLRALPFIPSAVISAGSGLLKIPLRLFIVATLLGSIVRDAFFLYLGYIGLSGAEQVIGQIDTVESLLQFTIILGVAAALIAYVYVYHTKRR